MELNGILWNKRLYQELILRENEYEGMKKIITRSKYYFYNEKLDKQHILKIKTQESRSNKHQNFLSPLMKFNYICCVPQW